MKKWLSMLLLIFMAMCCMNGACDQQEHEDKNSVKGQMGRYRDNGLVVPKYDWSIELDAAIQIYDARVRDKVRTWTVWRSNTGLIEGHCASIGYPIPYDVQLTNPWKYIGGSGAVLEQAEPSGLYSSHNSIATWVREVIVEKKQAMITPLYIESKVTCYAYPINVDYKINRVTRIKGAIPSIILQDKKPPNENEQGKIDDQVDKLKGKKEKKK